MASLEGCGHEPGSQQEQGQGPGAQPSPGSAEERAPADVFISDFWPSEWQESKSVLC